MNNTKDKKQNMNKNHGCGTTFDDLIEMSKNIDTSREKEAKKNLDKLAKKKDYKEECVKYILEKYGEKVLEDWKNIVKDDNILFAINNNTPVSVFVEAELY